MSKLTKQAIGYPEFSKTNTSLLKKYLSKEVFESLSPLKTSNGFTLSHAIRSGVENQDSAIGLYAGDHETYSLFAGLFDPIIRDYHRYPDSGSHAADFTPITVPYSNPDPEENYILSTRIRVGRNLSGFPLGTCISRNERVRVEHIIVAALSTLTGDLSGEYYPLAGMDINTRQELTQNHLLFKSGDRFLDSAGLNRDWPDGRGIFLSQNRTFSVWVNEEDQLRIISMDKGGEIKQVFNRLANAVEHLEKHLEFLFDTRLGYITSCPTNLGTAMRASVHIKLPNLAKKPDRLKQMADSLNLQVRGIHGEHSESKGGVFDISNKRRLGISEKQCIEDLYQGVVEIIREEAVIGNR